LLVVASSLACAVFRFEVAIMLLGLLAVISLFNHRTGKFGNLLRRSQRAELFVTTNDASTGEQAVVGELLETIKKTAITGTLLSVSHAEGHSSYHIKLSNADGSDGKLPDLVSRIKSISTVSKVNLLYEGS